MSTPTPSTPPPAGNFPMNSAVPATPTRRQIVIIGHSNLFYWWPVWAVGFLMTIISYFGDVVAIVPHGTKLTSEKVTVPVKDKDGKEGVDQRYALVFPKDADKPESEPRLHISRNKNVGIVFVAVLLLVIFITNIPLRGMWSFVAIMIIIFFTIIFAIMDWWATIFGWLTILDIRINMAGYFGISAILFLLWLVVFFFFDRQIYMIFEHGQLRVCQAIGDGETSYDTMGMTTMKQRSDLFRHWVLGLGSGDLIVKTSGAHPTEIHMNNVLFVGRRHAEMEEMLRSREMVAGEQNVGS
jgi:hypothetical protein